MKKSNHSTKGCWPVELMIKEPWIALVERGNCSFIQKVRMMQASGASGVIVGDDAPRMELTTMFANENSDDVTIPSVFIAQWTYRYLVYMSEKGPNDGISVILSQNENEWPIEEVLLIMVLSPVILLVAFYAFYAFVFWIKRRRKFFEMKKEVLGIPTKVFALEERKENDPETCAICLDDFVDEDELRILICRHEFHIDCIDPWLLERSRLCPICKQDVLPTESTSLLGSEQEA